MRGLLDVLHFTLLNLGEMSESFGEEKVQMQATALQKKKEASMVSRVL